MLLLSIVIAFVSPFTAFAVSSGSLPKITIFKHSFVDIVGDPNKNKNLELECYATGTPTPQIEFQLNNVALQSSSPRVKRKNVNHISILNASYPNDEGSYKCVATNKNGRVFKKKYIEIETLGYFTPGNRINDKLQVREVTLGRPLILPCPDHTKTYPVKYYWGKMGSPPKHIQQNKRIHVLDDGLLFISSLRPEDVQDINKSYHGISCILFSRGHRIASVKIALRVDGVYTGNIAPRVFQHLKGNIFIKKGDTKSLHCYASGNPVPAITWFRNGEQIETNDSRFGINPFQPGELTIRNFDKSLKGQYKCVLTNRMGKDETASNVKLAEPPHIDRVLTTKHIQRNSRLSLDCLASGTEPLTYQWYRNGNLLTSYSTTNATMEITDHILMIDFTNYDHMGRYQCLVYNEYGEASNVSDVFVIEPKYNKGHSVDSDDTETPSPPTKNKTPKYIKQSQLKLDMKYIIIIACGSIVITLLFTGGIMLYCRKKKDHKDVHYIPNRRPNLHFHPRMSPPSPIYSEPLELPPPPSSLTNYSDDDDDNDDGRDDFSYEGTMIRKKQEMLDLMNDIQREQQQSPILPSKHEHFYHHIPYLYENSSNLSSDRSTEL